MKLTFLCLFAFCCYSWASSTKNGNGRSQEERKLDEVLFHLRDLKQSLQHSEQLLNTPPRNIEDCCCLSALQCFRDNLPGQVSGTEKKRVKLFRSLRHPLTEKVLNFCDSGNAETPCQACAAHPKQNTTIFFKGLETLVNRAMERLKMN